MGRFSRLEAPGPSGATQPLHQRPGEHGEEAEASASALDLARPMVRGRRLPDGTYEPLEAPAPSQVFDHAYYYEQAQEAYFGGEVRRALQLYSRAIDQEATDLRPWLGQVLCLTVMQQYKEAAVWVKRALELYPQDTALISLQGYLYARQGATSRGLACSDFAMSLPQAHPLAWVFRGLILLSAENENSTFCFDRARNATPPGDWSVPAHLGLLLYEHRAWLPALEALKAATENCGPKPWLWVRLGQAQAAVGHSQLALKSYSHALQLAPGFRPAIEARDALLNTSWMQRLWARIFK